jgi:Cdc6-like AAA superfamily ATPase
MAAKRTTQSTTSKTASPKAGLAPKPPIKPQGLARLLGLKDYNAEQMATLLAAAEAEAQRYLEVEVPAEKQSHVYQQGVMHLAAKFYAAGNSDVEGPGDIPAICRYFLELVRRDLSSSPE